MRADLASYLTGERWYQRASAAAPEQTWPASIAYFSPEFGITAVLPQYSGGLGILAGDHLKAASDLGAPIVGVGLLYRHGYFKQALSREAWQVESYPVLDPDGLPISLLREADGERATVSLRLPGGPDLLAQVWVASVGRVPLLLLDTDFEANPEQYRLVTDRLYGGNTEHRLRQEPAPRRRRRPRAAGLLPDHRRPGAGGLPHQRGSCRLPRRGADPRVDRRRPGGLRDRPGDRPYVDRLHHAHARARRH
nr:DUF3417 domain-containing protein [Nocardioides convexus]